MDKMTFLIKILIVLTIGCTSFADQVVIYVDDDAIGANNGSSWDNAFIYLQDALTDAEAAEKPVEIRVAQGIYKPNQGVNISQVIFFLIDEVTLVGGYAGVNEHDPNTRDVENYETILSGDLNGDDIDVNNPRDLLSEPTRSDNHGPIVISDLTNQTAVLDGFIITGGCSRAVPFAQVVGGGGMKNDSGSPIIRNCTFTGNAALVGGGGMLNRFDSKPILTNCKFIDNYALSGGGIFNASSNPIFSHCFFKGNYATHQGGGMYNAKISVAWWRELENSCNPEIINCVFTGNDGDGGGGVFFGEDCNSIIINCSFDANIGKTGRALSCDSRDRINNIKLTNCILWDDGNEISNYDGSVITITYSNIQGGWEGKGNINEDPLFASPGYWADADDPNVLVQPNDLNTILIEGDYHLKSQAGRWNPVSQSWVQDDVTSPCIDAGDPNSPIGHEPFPNGGIINMGAYGGSSQASKSYFGKPVCETIIAGDINGDCKVDFDDLMILMAHWLEDHNPKY